MSSKSSDYVAPDTAALLALSLESGFYGVSTYMFAETMKELLFGGKFNRRMAIVASLFFVLSTAHVIIDIIRIKIGFIDQRDIFEGGPAAYFSQTLPLFSVRSSIYVAQTLLADAVVVYRCYMVWYPVVRWIVVVPLSLWLGLLVTSVGALYNLGVASASGGGAEIFAFGKWIDGFFAMSLTTNLVGTGLLAYRIWKINQSSSEFQSKGIMVPVFRVVIDAGILYSIVLIITLAFFEARSNMQTILIDMLMPIISISFYMIIIRMSALSGRGGALGTEISFQLTTHSFNLSWAASEPHSTDYRGSSSFPGPRTGSKLEDG
ncbi:hypothetical protein D9758_017326 [Tetrapyrgos nigripes]|uniref:Uncharacterized protein n=1 Tax=Tetrapyrgos nigripes TaxID=182062 RepID=A0A8H5BSG5_9AGAR|nr:hypothetical protein D9758_017326 [Tetrapyrgos nigripes]